MSFDFGDDLLDDNKKAMGLSEPLEEFAAWMQNNYNQTSQVIGDNGFRPLDMDESLRYSFHPETGIGVVWDWHGGGRVADTFYSSAYEKMSPADKERARNAVRDFQEEFKKQQEITWKKRAGELSHALQKMKPLSCIHGYLFQKNYQDVMTDQELAGLGLYEGIDFKLDALEGCKNRQPRWKGQIVVPYFDKDGHISTLEALLDYDHEIHGKDGKTRNKDWASDARKGGAFHPIGFNTRDINSYFSQKCYICEGYATGLAIYLATGKPVVVCGDAGNIVKVAPLFPNAVGIADYDAESGTGDARMEEAKVPHILMRDPESPEKSMDADDYLRAHGKEALLDFIERGRNSLYGQMAFPPLSWQMEHALDTEEGFLVNDWLIRGGLHALLGDSGKGKSFIALDLALSLATGRQEWGGRKINGKAHVAYLCGEAYRSFLQRLSAWLLDKEFKVDQVEDYFNLTKCIYKMNEPEALAELERALKTLPWTPDVLIVDTFSRYFSGDENDSKDAKPFLDALHKLADRGNMAILYLAHFNKTEKTKQAGSKEWEAQADYCWTVECENPVGKSIEGYRMALVQTKSKDGEPLRQFFMPRGVEIGTRASDGLPITSLVLDTDDTPMVAKSNLDKTRKLTGEEKVLADYEESDMAMVKLILDKFVASDDWKNAPYKISPDSLRALDTRDYTPEELAELDAMEDGPTKNKARRKIDQKRTRAFYTDFDIREGGKLNFIKRCKKRYWADWIADPDKLANGTAVAYTFNCSFDLNYWSARRKRETLDLEG